MKKILSVLMVLVLALILSACGGRDIAALWQKASPKEKAILLLETYNTQYDQYYDVLSYATGLTPETIKYMAKNDPVGLKEAIDSSSLTDEATITLRYKKSMLEKLDTPMEEFGRLARAGLPTSAEQERFILETLNKLKYRAYTE
jgi:hypothetical protein